MIRLEQVSKQYERGGETVHALRPVSLEISAGEFVALIGPSGSGKSTLLAILGGMLSPSQGKVWLQGESLYDLSVAARAKARNERIGFVFQAFNLVPWLSAVENVELPIRLYGGDAAYARSRGLDLLKRFDLSNRVEHKPEELSSGQQQRVALARLLAMDPQLILADEPTGNLDPDSRSVVLQTLQELQREGKTIILVTHDPTVSAIAQRVLRITDGTVTEVAAPSS